MHVSDALISPPVAIFTGSIAVSLIAIASRKIKNNDRPDLVPLMGIMGAFVFAAQMINFTIPGTGSSGHLIGGVLLSAILGPWCAFITLSSILIVQCLIFGDGGLLALGCNVVNMAATSCLIAYPLVYRPIVGRKNSNGRILLGSILSSVLALELGALFVTCETEFSGITALPFSTFTKFMLPIHFVIGLIEGIVTASLLLFVAHNRPKMLFNQYLYNNTKDYKKKFNAVIITFLALTVIMAGGFSVLASQNPDGLEWSVDKVAGLENFQSEMPSTVIIPEYDSSFAGILGAVIVMVILWGVSSLIFSKFRKKTESK